MPFAAVLDASVLYPLPLRDTLLRIADTELYDAYWSARRSCATSSLTAALPRSRPGA